MHWQRAAKANGVEQLEDAYEDDGVRSDAEEGMLAGYGPLGQARLTYASET